MSAGVRDMHWRATFFTAGHGGQGRKGRDGEGGGGGGGKANSSHSAMHLLRRFTEQWWLSLRLKRMLCDVVFQNVHACSCK